MENRMRDHNKTDDGDGPFEVVYGKGKWWASRIQSYACMALSMQGEGFEQNHLVHAAFFDKGPAHLQHLAAYVPCITLTFEEHRGRGSSFHHMKDQMRTGPDGKPYHGCGMDAFLLSKGIRVKQPRFTEQQVAKAIDASAEYWRLIGMDHAAAAVREFKERVFSKAVAQSGKAQR
jgi:hypothetical protein